MEDKPKQTYTIEEKTGRIVKVEEATEIQKQQKKSLVGTILIVSAAIIASATIIVSSSKVSKPENIQAEVSISREKAVETFGEDAVVAAEEKARKETIDNEATMEKATEEAQRVKEEAQKNLEEGNYSEFINNAGEHVSQEEQTQYQEAAQEYVNQMLDPSVLVYQKEKKINDEWIEQTYMFLQESPPVDSAEERYVLKGIYPDKDITVYREMISDDTGILTPTGSYYFGVIPPSEEFKYAYVGTLQELAVNKTELPLAPIMETEIVVNDSMEGRSK